MLHGSSVVWLQRCHLKVSVEMLQIFRVTSKSQLYE